MPSRVTSADVAGPGFLNLRLSAAAWHGVIGAVLAAGTDFGRATLGQGQQVNVEYVSANPTGPLHVGHTRGAVFGDALASLLDFSVDQAVRYRTDDPAKLDDRLIHTTQTLARAYTQKKTLGELLVCCHQI